MGSNFMLPSHCKQTLFSVTKQPSTPDVISTAATFWVKNNNVRRRYLKLFQNLNGNHWPSHGGQRAMPSKCLEYLVILCFERRYPKQNTVIPNKILAKNKKFCPLKFFAQKKVWAGYATDGNHGVLTILLGSLKTFYYA